jgi:hypothetical protein
MSWLFNRKMEFTSLAGIAIDMTITCLIMATAITFFTTSGVREALKTGNIKSGDSYFAEKSLSRLPHNGWRWAFCSDLSLQSARALTIVILYCGRSCGLSFLWLVIFKAIYTGLMAFTVTALVILRQLEAPQ